MRHKRREWKQSEQEWVGHEQYDEQYKYNDCFEGGAEKC